jgi:hypothetical protein
LLFYSNNCYANTPQCYVTYIYAACLVIYHSTVEFVEKDMEEEEEELEKKGTTILRIRTHLLSQ